MSSPEHDLAEASRILANKASEDATAVREFAGNLEIADSIIGFHSQQAVEKWLKGVMASRGLKQTRTHDIDRLLEVLADDGCELPPAGVRLDELTQYAVPLRYDQLLDAEPLDRRATVALVVEVGDWADTQLHPSDKGR
ncbi:MAG TPA: HEPN domain-containing protein [Solirubrobacterales bacterium]|nr:HEPN domain-containing protein [Solirubrobacterales bacterium]